MIALRKCRFRGLIALLPLVFDGSAIARQHAGDPPHLVVGDPAPQIEVEQWLTGDSFGASSRGWCIVSNICVLMVRRR